MGPVLGPTMSATGPDPVGRRVTMAGRTIWVDDDKPTFWDRVAAGTWEPGTLNVLDRYVGPGTTFLDLGAWIGPLSLYAAARGTRVISVEADPAALDDLRRNIIANPDLAARIAIVPRAVWPEPGRVRMGSRRKPGDSMSSVLLADAGASWMAETVTPSAVAEMVGPGPLFIKIDIEGGEYALLPALDPLLHRPGTLVLVSFHPAILREAGEADNRARTERALAPFGGWRSYAVEETGPVLRTVDPQALSTSDGRGYPDTWLFVKP